MSPLNASFKTWTVNYLPASSVLRVTGMEEENQTCQLIFEKTWWANELTRAKQREKSWCSYCSLFFQHSSLGQKSHKLNKLSQTNSGCETECCLSFHLGIQKTSFPPYKIIKHSLTKFFRSEEAFQIRGETSSRYQKPVQLPEVDLQLPQWPGQLGTFTGIVCDDCWVKFLCLSDTFGKQRVSDSDSNPEPFRAVFGRRWVCTVDKTAVSRRAKQTFALTLTPTANLEFPIWLRCIPYDCGRKP